MYKWFKDRSITQYGLAYNYEDRKFYITDLKEDKKEVELTGSISMDKPNASIYMNIKLNSSEQPAALIQTKEYMINHTGWAVFDSHLFQGKIMYRITDQSKEKIQNIKQKIIDLKFELNSEMEKLKSYNSESDYNNDNYENSNLKHILYACEQAYNKANDFINLGRYNGWIQKF